MSSPSILLLLASIHVAFASTIVPAPKWSIARKLGHLSGQPAKLLPGIHNNTEPDWLALYYAGYLKPPLRSKDATEEDQSWWEPHWGKWRLRSSLTPRKMAGEVLLDIWAWDIVSDLAVEQTRLVLEGVLLNTPLALLENMKRHEPKIGLYGKGQTVTDIPAHHYLTQPQYGGYDYWKERAEGLGATTWVPWSTTFDANILETSDTRWWNENILVHEFAHMVMNLGLDEECMLPQVEERYAAAWWSGVWSEGAYAMSSDQEYFAMSAAAWLHATARSDLDSTDTMSTRRRVRLRDPMAADIMEYSFGNGDWRYTQVCRNCRRTWPRLEPLRPGRVPLSPEFKPMPVLCPATDGSGADEASSELSYTAEEIGEESAEEQSWNGVEEVPLHFSYL